LYAEVLKNRLGKETEEKRMIPETQGFRRGRSMIDNIFVIIHIIQREGSKKGQDGKFMIFADLKAAFDKVDRGKLWDCLREKGIRESLIRRIEKTYEGTEVTKLGNTESFVTKRGVRQGCVMSPLLFNLYIAELKRKI